MKSPRNGASALGRLGRRLEAAIRDSLIKEAGYALWFFIVQREACGLNDSTHVMQTYGVPNKIYVRVGPSRRGSF